MESECPDCAMQIRFVKGIDISEAEIWEAKKRFEEARLERRGALMQSTTKVYYWPSQLLSLCARSHWRLHFNAWQLQSGYAPHQSYPVRSDFSVACCSHCTCLMLLALTPSLKTARRLHMCMQCRSAAADAL